MLIRTICSAAFVGTVSVIPLSVPLVILAAVLLIVVSLALVLWALGKKDRVQARLRLGRWYSFSLDAGTGALGSQSAESKLAPKARRNASKA
jgi:hypothetical protein